MKVLVLTLTNIEFWDVEHFSSLYHILSFNIVFKRICSPSGRYKFRAQEPVRKAKLLEVWNKSISIKNMRQFQVFGLRITSCCLFRDMNCSLWNHQFYLIISFCYLKGICGVLMLVWGFYLAFLGCFFCSCSFKQIFSQTSNSCWSQRSWLKEDNSVSAVTA